MTGSRNVLDPVMCQVITLTNAVSFVWNKIQYNDITNITSWKKLQGRLQSISAILTHLTELIYLSYVLTKSNQFTQCTSTLSPFHKTDHAEALEFIVAS